MLVNKLVLVAWAAVLVGLRTATPAGGSSLVMMGHTQDTLPQDVRIQDIRLQDTIPQDIRLQDTRLEKSFSRDNLKPVSDERSTEKEEKKTEKVKKKKQKEKETRFMREYLKKRWPDRVVPVMIDKDHPPLKKEMVHAGIALFNKLTCLSFINTTDPDKYYLRITSSNKNMCFANVGYEKHKRGFQDANFGVGCFYSMKVILHELTHTLGFHHQQFRVDRDDYVTVNFTNIMKGRNSNFVKDEGTATYLRTLGLPYEYNSIMHYSFYAFTKGSKFGPTITLKRKFPGQPGTGEGFARIDVASINRYYECWNHYLGDDIPGSVPYDDFHAFFMSPKRGRKKATQAFGTWIDRMRSKYSQ